MTPMIIDENLGNGGDEHTPLMQRLGRRLLVRGRKVARPGVQIDINLERPKSLGTVGFAMRTRSAIRRSTRISCHRRRMFRNWSPP